MTRHRTAAAICRQIAPVFDSSLDGWSPFMRNAEANYERWEKELDRRVPPVRETAYRVGASARRILEIRRAQRPKQADFSDQAKTLVDQAPPPTEGPIDE
jgi:hypothetical protein